MIALRPGRKNKNFITVADKICCHFDASLTLLNIVSSSEKKHKVKRIESGSKELISNTQCVSNIKIIESNSPVEAVSEESASYDLLILGTPEKDNWIRVLFGTGEDRFVKKAACSVLRLTLK